MDGVGNRILRRILEGGYEGRVCLVKLIETEIVGLKAYPSVASLPEVPNAVLICVPAPAVPTALEEVAREDARVAEEFSVAMVGPNSMGYFSARAAPRDHGHLPPVGGLDLFRLSGREPRQPGALAGDDGTRVIARN